MEQGSTASIALQIQRRAAALAGVAGEGHLDQLERLRDETACLQALIAEATRARRTERRAFERGTALLAPAIIEMHGFSGFCLVDNLSRQGMTAKAFTTLPTGQPMRVHFASDEAVEGMLVWSHADRIGVEFDEPIAVPQVLLGARGSGKPKRPARLAVCGEIELTAGTRRLEAEVIDVSQHGLKIVGAPVSAGEQVSVGIEGFERKAARVRWSRSGTMGLNFLRPMSFSELGRWGG